MKAVVVMLTFLFIIFQETLAVIYRLNESDYTRMPTLFHYEEYEPCLVQPGGLYCTAEFHLVSEQPSELLTMIQDYSAQKYTHFDHTRLQHGVCVTKTCKRFMQNATYNYYNMSEITNVLEACYNETLYTDYKLKARIVNGFYCNRHDETVVLDAGDIVVAIVCVGVVLFNIIGSLFDYYRVFGVKTQVYQSNNQNGTNASEAVGLHTNKLICKSDNEGIGQKLLLCFAIRRNWNKLKAPSGVGPEPRLKRLKAFNAFKALTIALVILGHNAMPVLCCVDNPRDFEEIYNNILYHIILNGTLIVQTFFTLSGFLLCYNLLLYSEKHRVNWTMLPNGIILRWLRLTPPYALVLGITSTWLRHIGSGPLWQPAVGVEVNDCRRDWWYNLIYLNNYIDNSQCMAHTWYLAADMQLYCLGLTLCILIKSNKARKIMLCALLILGVIFPAAHTYFQDLDAILLLTPETARYIFTKDATFNNVYKRGHTNLFCFTMGLVLASLVHHLQKNNFDINKYRKYRIIYILYWAVVPCCILLMFTGRVFYDVERVPVLVRALYASLIKPLFGVAATLLLIGTIFKLENVYRGVLEWRGWVAPSRISYCAYLLHVLFLRTYTGTITSLHYSFYHMALTFFSFIVVTFMMALPLWLMVEAPLCEVVKICLMPRRDELKQQPHDVQKEPTNDRNGEKL